MHLPRRHLLTATLLAGTVALAGCGQSDDAADTPQATTTTTTTDAAPTTGAQSPAGTPASGPHNEADVQFAAMMVPHHEQALEMTGIVLPKDGLDPQVAELAQQIEAAQGPEIERMTGWLEGWGEEPMADVQGMDGILSQEQMQALRDAPGPEASRLFLTGMIEHHQGAVDMGRTELADGANPEAKELAQSIIDSQQEEIAQMQSMLDGSSMSPSPTS